ncbi:hypothetical protein JCM8547_003007 [Rhodosporidiobolus lusitaniae]
MDDSYTISTLCGPSTFPRPSSSSSAGFISNSSLDDKPNAIDLSDHLSVLAKSRMQSPLKGLYKYFQRPGILILAGGLPPPEYFPFETISATTLAKNSFKTSDPSFGAWLLSFLPGAGKKKTDAWDIPKYAAQPTQIQLSSALQYGTAAGLPPLATFVYDFTRRVFQPAYADFHTVLNAGSTDAWGKIATTLAEPGDGVLCEEWSYPSAMATVWPNGLRPVPLKMDGEGMTPEGLEALLANWNPEERGEMRRPRLMYTIPVCQNPTGATMSLERKKQIYKIAVKYDVIIVEDDPYYFLQTPPFEPDTALRAQNKPKQTESDEEFLKSLVPSYLALDYQGRVVRIDTFSKTICPGSRLGWTTCNPVFAERLERANESSTQAASGFSQALVGKLLAEEWGFEAYLRWLKGIKAQYTARRDTLTSLLLNEGGAALESRTRTSLTGPPVFELYMPETRDEKGFLMSEKSVGGARKVLSFTAPDGGMFIWLRVHLASHPSYPHIPASELLQSLWEEIAEANLLVGPGSMFNMHSFGQEESIQQAVEEDRDGFFRLSFSNATEEQMKQAAEILKKTVASYFRG